MGGYVVDACVADEGELARAWPRFWARMFDIVLYAFPAGALIGLTFPGLFAPELLESRGGQLLVGILALPLVMIIDAVVIAWLGTSPGKAIAGLQVADLEHNKLSLETSLTRNLQVYLKGLVLGLPLLSLIGYVKGHADVRDQGFTSWDEATGSRVFASSNNDARTILAAVCAIAALGLDRALSQGIL